MGAHLAFVQQHAAEGDLFAIFLWVLKLGHICTQRRAQLGVQLRECGLHQRFVEDLRHSTDGVGRNAGWLVQCEAAAQLLGTGFRKYSINYMELNFYSNICIRIYLH